jgi:hypothetical protein
MIKYLKVSEAGKRISWSIFVVARDQTCNVATASKGCDLLLLFARFGVRAATFTRAVPRVSWDPDVAQCACTIVAYGSRQASNARDGVFPFSSSVECKSSQSFDISNASFGSWDPDVAQCACTIVAYGSRQASNAHDVVFPFSSSVKCKSSQPFDISNASFGSPMKVPS